MTHVWHIAWYMAYQHVAVKDYCECAWLQ